ncbi:MAG: hypothetical protein QNJ98_13540 [Planctomycetota bacterium]|nr:hypothetical protein [Planctomycetota bacterium]
MRFTKPLALLAVLLLAVGCGGESDTGGGSTNGGDTPSSSTKPSPSGDKIKFSYAMEKGEGVRMSMKMAGTMKMSGAHAGETPMDMETVMTMRCVDVKENSDRVLEIGIEAMKMAIAGERGLPDSMFEDMKGRMTIDKSGRMKDMDWSGGDPQITEQLKKMFSGSGFQTFVPLPAEGLAIGEAVDYKDIVPPEMMEQLMGSAVPGATLKPTLEGQMVLVGTRKVDGEQAAEFAVDVTMKMKGSISQMGQTVEMDQTTTIKGTQFISLRGGFPVGVSEMKMSMTGDMVSQGETVKMGMDMTMTIESSKF